MLTAILGLINGPVFSIIDKLIPDPDLKLKLKTEIEKAAQDAQSDIVNAQRDVLLAEYEVESWLTRSWRPCLMFLAMFVLLIYGIILPLVNLFFNEPIGFIPLWEEVPDGVWELLKWGVAGYVGGRSMEKIARVAKDAWGGTSRPRKKKRRNFGRLYDQ